MERTQHLVETIHQTVGYPVAFVLVPFLLATFAGKPGHRPAGWAFLVLMTFLYLTGTFMTLTRHDWWSWGFSRNLAFNFFGYSLLLYGLRSAYLLHRSRVDGPAVMDYALSVLLLASVAGLAWVALAKDVPMRAYAFLGVLLVALDWRDIRAGFQPRKVLFNRHVRFVLGSYFYVFTVVSLVHLDDELPRDVQWLWPTAIGVVAVYLLTANRSLLAKHRGTVTRTVLTVTGIVAIGLGVYAISEFLFGPINVRLPGSDI